MSDSLVDTTNFPIYAVNFLSEDVFVVGGGGGASKTGIPNAFVSFSSLFTSLCIHLFTC